jgi:hypothetical protein
MLHGYESSALKVEQHTHIPEESSLHIQPKSDGNQHIFMLLEQRNRIQ